MQRADIAAVATSSHAAVIQLSVGARALAHGIHVAATPVALSTLGEAVATKSCDGHAIIIANGGAGGLEYRPCCEERDAQQQRATAQATSTSAEAHEDARRGHNVVNS